MDKNYRLILAFLLIAVILGGCQKNTAGITLDVEECANLLKEAITFSDTLAAVSSELITTIYQIKPEDVVTHKVYAGTGATAEEIAVFEAVNNEAALRIEEALQRYIAERKAAFADYLPLELPKLEEPFLKVEGNYVVLCISDQNETAAAVLDKLINDK
ncbi:MAG: DUF4358 domain-containing protein [Firmicutes bacterium]|nr:DUF4358 domain-containing protein [Bacillota bacterium]